MTTILLPLRLRTWGVEAEGRLLGVCGGEAPPTNFARGRVGSTPPAFSVYSGLQPARPDMTSPAGKKF